MRIRFRKNILLLAFLKVLFILLIFQNIIENYITISKYFDEIFSAIVFTCGIILWLYCGKGRINKVNLIWISGLALYNILGWMSSFEAGYTNIKVAIFSFFLANKFFISMIGIALLFIYSNLFDIIVCITNIIRPTLIAVGAWQILAHIISGIYEFNILELCAKTVFLISLIIMSWRGRRDYIYIVLGCLMLLSTQKGKAYGAVFIILAVLIWVIELHKKIGCLELISGGIAVIFVAWNKVYLNYVIGVQKNFPRAVLMKYGALIANRSFPLGTGWGTFGSYYAAECYSPIYLLLGWNDRKYVSTYFKDSYWPMVFCENGWIGFVGLIIALVALFCVIQKEYDVNRKYYASAIVAFAYLMVTTLESTSFANPSVIILAVIFGIILKEQKGNQRI